MIAQDTKASGALVIDAERMSKAYGERAVVRDFSLRVMRRDRIGIVGANGAGKTTLVNLLTGALAPDSGSVRLGANVAMASLDQGRASLEPTTTLVDALTGGGSDYVTINGERRHVHGLHARLPVPARAGAHADRQIVRRRARAAHAREGAGEAVQPARSRRADQRPRHRDAGSPAGTAWRLCRNDPPRQPRSRFSRSRRDIGHCRRRRWALGRICGRLFRHGRPARVWACRSAGRAGRRGGEAGEAARSSGPPRSASSGSTRAARSKRCRDAIDKLRADLEALEAKLADADFPAREPAAFTDATRAYAELRDALAGAEDEWLGLEILREELERQ